MTDATVSSISQLLEVLQAERTALLDGELERASALSVEKERLALALESEIRMGVDKRLQPQLKQLQAALARSASLLQNSIKGVQMAQLRMQEVVKKSGEVGVYDPEGGRPQITGTQPRLGKYA